MLHMLTLVQHQMVLLEEGTIAFAANMRPHRAFSIWMPLVVQLQAVLGCKALVAMLTEMRFRLRLVRLMVNNDLRLLRLRLHLVLLHDLNGTDGRFMILTRHRRVNDWSLL